MSIKPIAQGRGVDPLRLAMREPLPCGSSVESCWSYTGDYGEWESRPGIAGSGDRPGPGTYRPSPPDPARSPRVRRRVLPGTKGFW
jgi:hypothetical protein